MALENLLNFKINWGETYRIAYEFRTDIIVSRNGREQRRSLRATPRKSIQYKCTLGRLETHRFNQLLVKSRHRQITSYEATRFTRSAVDASIGAMSVVIGVSAEWLTVGGYVALTYLDDVEFLQIGNLSTFSIGFVTPVTRQWPAGTKIHPVLVGSLTNDVRAQRPTNEASTVSVNFNVDPGYEKKNLPGTSVRVLDGREVFLLRPNWSNDIEFSSSHMNEMVDYGRGRTQTFSHFNFNTHVFEASYVSRDATDANVLLKFFERMGGQRGEFYMPSWQNDMEMRVTAYPGLNTLRVKGPETFDAYQTDTVHRAIAVFLRGGDIVFKRVTSLLSVNDVIGNDTILNCADLWAAQIDPADVLMICWMPVWRHATDILTMEWISDTVAQTKLSLRSLENLPIEI